MNIQKNYLNQVALIQSECQPRKKPINIPATVFNRSPIRDRQNRINLGNINPALSGNTPGKSVKGSLSPLRSRRCQTSNSVRSTMSKRKIEMECSNNNHPPKIAKFYVQSDGEVFLYCQKCAINLASQGFKVVRMTDPTENHNSHRRKEIEDFLGELQVFINNVRKRQMFVDQLLSNASNCYDSELQKVQAYYSQFYELIDEHKRRVLQQMKSEYDLACSKTKQNKDLLIEAMANIDDMKKDIHQTMNTIIMEAQQSQYRPVMDLYKQRVKKHRNIIGNMQITQQEIKVKKVCCKEGQQLCQGIIDGLGIEWEDQMEASVTSKASQKPESENHQNPVECINSQDKGRSSLKQLGGLFCSFDQ